MNCRNAMRHTTSQTIWLIVTQSADYVVFPRCLLALVKLSLSVVDEGSVPVSGEPQSPECSGRSFLCQSVVCPSFSLSRGLLCLISLLSFPSYHHHPKVDGNFVPKYHYLQLQTKTTQSQSLTPPLSQWRPWR